MKFPETNNTELFFYFCICKEREQQTSTTQILLSPDLTLLCCVSLFTLFPVVSFFASVAVRDIYLFVMSIHRREEKEYDSSCCCVHLQMECNVRLIQEQTHTNKREKDRRENDTS
jgi:hypothetical protein